MRVTPRSVAEPLEPPGVLGGDHVGAGQLLGQPRRRVGDPSDRGGGEHQEAGRRSVAASIGEVTDRSCQPRRVPGVTPARTLDERPAVAGLSRTAAGDVVPPARERRAAAGAARGPARRAGRPRSRSTLLAFFLRLWQLGTPREFEFDETYYAKDAWSLLNHGYVREYVDNANERILDGRTTGLWKDDPSMIVHPEVGKWLIALGEKAFGMDPFGWRIAAAVVGSLMVLVHDPAGAPAHRLDAARLRRRAAAVLRRPALGAVPAGAARHLPGVLHALRACTAWSPTGTGPAPGWRASATDRSAPGWGPVRGLLFRPWLALAGRVVRARRRHQVDRALPAGRVRRPGLAVERRGAAELRGPLAGAEVGARSTAYPRSCTWCWSPSSSTSRRGPAGWCTRTSTSSTCPRPSTPAT